jgi:hypothetical protein
MPETKRIFCALATAAADPNIETRSHTKPQLNGRSFARAKQGHHFTINKDEYFTANKNE